MVFLVEISNMRENQKVNTMRDGMKVKWTQNSLFGCFIGVPRIEGETKTMLAINWKEMFTASDFFITIFAHIKCLVTINANLFEWKKIFFDSKFRFQDISFKNSPEMHNISMFDYRSQLDISCYRWCCWIHHKRFPCFHKSVAVSTSKTGQTLLKYTLRNFFFISERKWKIENSRNKCHSTWSLPTPI